MSVRESTHTESPLASWESLLTEGKIPSAPESWVVHSSPITPHKEKNFMHCAQQNKTINLPVIMEEGNTHFIYPLAMEEGPARFHEKTITSGYWSYSSHQKHIIPKILRTIRVTTKIENFASISFRFFYLFLNHICREIHRMVQQVTRTPLTVGSIALRAATGMEKWDKSPCWLEVVMQCCVIRNIYYSDWANN